MLEYSSKGTVPVLVIGNTVIDESLDIMQWALHQSDPNNWLQEKEQLELIELCDCQFKPQLDRYKYSDRYELSEAECRNKTTWFLDHLSEKLSNKKYLLSNQISLADMAVFPFNRQFSMVDHKWFGSTVDQCLQIWLYFHLDSELFKNIMVKHSLW